MRYVIALVVCGAGFPPAADTETRPTALLPWRAQIEQRLRDQHELIVSLLQRSQPAPAAPSPPQTLPIPGEPRQVLPIPGEPRQPLPIPGEPKQILPVPGAPKQVLPPSGPPRQDLPIGPQSYTVRAIGRPIP